MYTQRTIDRIVSLSPVAVAEDDDDERSMHFLLLIHYSHRLRIRLILCIHSILFCTNNDSICLSKVATKTHSNQLHHFNFSSLVVHLDMRSLQCRRIFSVSVLLLLLPTERKKHKTHNHTDAYAAVLFSELVELIMISFFLSVFVLFYSFFCFSHFRSQSLWILRRAGRERKKQKKHKINWTKHTSPNRRRDFFFFNFSFFSSKNAFLCYSLLLPFCM